MNKTFRYKNFTGSIEKSSEDACLYGKILFIRDLITYEATTAKQLEKEFKRATDDYLITCKKLNREPSLENTK